jgi:hypothetical protein
LRMDQVHVIRHKVLLEGKSVRSVAKEMGVSLRAGRRRALIRPHLPETRAPPYHPHNHQSLFRGVGRSLWRREADDRLTRQARAPCPRADYPRRLLPETQTDRGGRPDGSVNALMLLHCAGWPGWLDLRTLVGAISQRGEHRGVSFEVSWRPGVRLRSARCTA